MTISLNYKSFGEGETVIILHGLFGMLDNWKSFARRLSKDYHVYTLDFRDHGRSPKTSLFNYDILAEDIRDFLDQHSLESSYFIGHSMGGKATIRFAADYPEWVKKMVIVDIGIKEYPGGHEYILDTILKIDISKINDRYEVEGILQSDINDPAILQFLLKNLSRIKDNGFEWKANFSLLKKNYKEIISAIEMDTPLYTPCLFVKGGRSKYIKENDWEDIQENFYNTELIVFPEAGHWVHADQPDQLLTEVRKFFRK